MTAHQYRTASRCTEERTVVNQAVAVKPVAVKRIRTVIKPEPTRVEQSPVVRVEQRVDLRRRLARIREDYQSLGRLRAHMEEDMADLERRLGKKPRQH